MAKNKNKHPKRQPADERTIKRAVRYADGVVEHGDLVFLMTLHIEKKFGAKQLADFYRKAIKRNNEYRKYLGLDDAVKFGAHNPNGDKLLREDTYKLKEDLKKIGFDYDAIVAELEVEQDEFLAEERRQNEEAKRAITAYMHKKELKEKGPQDG